jgi:hypothetical protein
MREGGPLTRRSERIGMRDAGFVMRDRRVEDGQAPSEGTRPTGLRLQGKKFLMIWWKFSLTMRKTPLCCCPAEMRIRQLPDVLLFRVRANSVLGYPLSVNCWK